MSDSPERIQVEIFGASYSLRGGSDARAIRTLAHDLDARMREIAGGAPGADPLKVAVLAALRLAEEARALRAEKTESEERIGVRLDALGARLTLALALPAPETGAPA